MAQKFNKKEFRHAISVLKRKGFVPPYVDARSAEPFHIRSGKTLSEYVKKHRAVLESEDKSRKPSKPAKERPAVEILKLNVPYENLEQYLEDAMSDTKRIDSMKHKREYFAFEFYGHKSLHIYESIEDALEDLMHYQSIQSAINENSARDMQEVVKNLAVVRVKNLKTWKDAPDHAKHRKHGKNADDYWKKQYAKKKAKIKRSPKWKQEQTKKQNADRQKAYRDSLSNAEVKKYQAAARERAAESRSRKKTTVAKKKGKGKK